MINNHNMAKWWGSEMPALYETRWAAHRGFLGKGMMNSDAGNGFITFMIPCSGRQSSSQISVCATRHCSPSRPPWLRGFGCHLKLVFRFCTSSLWRALIPLFLESQFFSPSIKSKPLGADMLIWCIHGYFLSVFKKNNINLIFLSF